MMKKAFALTAAIVLSVGAFACSSSSDAASKAADGDCPAVGDKVCSNDDAATQSDVDQCNSLKSDSKCGDKFTAYYKCLGANVSCDSNGHNTDDGSKCQSEATAYGTCASGSTSTGDGGT